MMISVEIDKLMDGSELFHLWKQRSVKVHFTEFVSTFSEL